MRKARGYNLFLSVVGIFIVLSKFLGGLYA